MAGAFSARDDLRGWVCAGLERAAVQARQVLRSSTSHQHLIGFADPLGASGGADEEEDDDDDMYGARPARSMAAAKSVASMRRAVGGRAPSLTTAAHDAPHHLQPPEGYGVAVAEATVLAMRMLSKNWLSVLCKVGPAVLLKWLGVLGVDCGAAGKSVTMVMTVPGDERVRDHVRTPSKHDIPALTQAAHLYQVHYMFGHTSKIKAPCSATQLSISLTLSLTRCMCCARRRL
jgi:hypothetical protein